MTVLNIVPPTYDITMKGTFAWKLVLEYENESDISVTHTFARTRITTYNSRIFSLTLNKTTVAYLDLINDVDIDPNDVFYETRSANISDSCEHAKEVNRVLEKAQGGLEVESMTTETDTRTYTIAPQSTLSLYQRYFTAPGIHYDCNAYGIAVEKQDDKVPVDIVVKCQQVRFIVDVMLHHGSTPEEEPIGAVHQYAYGPQDASNNVNCDYANKYTWLVPVYTLNKSHAATSFELHVGRPDYKPEPPAHKPAHGSKSPPHVNLSHGTNTTDYRYLSPVVSDSPYKIYDLALLRSPDGEELSWDPTWGYDGMTEDINENRKGNPLYLAWKLRAAAAV